MDFDELFFIFIGSSDQIIVNEELYQDMAGSVDRLAVL
jgi:hypothetical protein